MALMARGLRALVMDGEKALYLENDGTPQAPRMQLIDKLNAATDADSEHSDRPGRMPDPGPGQMSAMEQTDLAREAKERFAARVASWMDRHLAADPEARVILAAPPQMLAVLRHQIAPATAARIMAELPKTLTQMPLDRLGPLLAADIDQL